MAFLVTKSLPFFQKKDVNATIASVNSSLIEVLSPEEQPKTPQKILHNNNNTQNQLLDEKQPARPSSIARHGPLLEAQDSANDVDDNDNKCNSISFQDMTFSARCLEWLVLIAGFSQFNAKCPCCGKLYSILVFLSIVFSLIIEIYNYTSDTCWLYFAIYTVYIQVLVLYLVAKCKLMPDLYQNTPDGSSIVRASAASIANYNAQTRARVYGNYSFKHPRQRKSHSVLHDVMHSRAEVVSFASPKHGSFEPYCVLQQRKSISSGILKIKVIYIPFRIFVNYN